MPHETRLKSECYENYEYSIVVKIECVTVVQVIRHKRDYLCRRHSILLSSVSDRPPGTAGVSIIWRICELVVIRCNKMQACPGAGLARWLDTAPARATLGGRYLSYDKLIFTIDPFDKNKNSDAFGCRMLDALRSHNVSSFIGVAIHICISIGPNTFCYHIISIPAPLVYSGKIKI